MRKPPVLLGGKPRELDSHRGTCGESRFAWCAADPQDKTKPGTGDHQRTSRRHTPLVVARGNRGGGGHRRRRIPAWLGTRAGGGTDEAATTGENGQPTGKAALGFIAGDKAKGTAPALETVAAELVQRSRTLRLTGTLIANEKSSVASNTSGIAAEVRVDRGSVVKKGDVLVQIDATDAKNKLAEGQALIDELKARLGIDGPAEKFIPEDEPEVRLAKASADLAAANFKRAKDTSRPESNLDRGL